MKLVRLSLRPIAYQFQLKRVSLSVAACRYTIAKSLGIAILNGL